MNNITLLSVVVPAYKQEKIIVKSVRSLKSTLAAQPIPFEIIVVVDGFVDATYEKLIKLRSKNVRVLGYQENKGKGFAVKYGMSRAKGDVIGFIDADLDIDPAGISMLLNHMIWYDADIIVGSKLHPVSQVQYPIARKIMSWGYRTFTRTTFGFRIRDTQVGLKLFKREVINDVLPVLLVKRFAFDVELLAVAYSFGYTRIYEAPIKLQFNPGSTINKKNFWSIILHTLWDTSAVFYRVKILRYYKKSKIRDDMLTKKRQRTIVE